FSSRRRHTRFSRDWSSDVCSSDLGFANFRTGAVGSFGSAFLEHQPAAGRLALIGQSGGACITVYNGARALGVDFGAVLMTGNERSEERRVGKEGRCGWLRDHTNKN